MNRTSIAGCIALLLFTFGMGGPCLRAQFAITGASWISGSGSTDYMTGVAIRADGKINVAGNIGDASPGGLEPILLSGAGLSSGGAVLRLGANGDTVLSVTRVAGEIHDLAMDGQENLYLAAGADGLIKLSPEADEVLWKVPNGGYCRRLDVGADGTVVGLNNNGTDSGTCFVYDASGNEIGSFAGFQRTQDVAISTDPERVYQTGFKNNHSGCNPVQVAYLRSVDYTGLEVWRNYDWNGTNLDNCDGDGWDNLMADTRGYRVIIGDDGFLYAAFEVAGGNHIFSREPDNSDLNNLKTPVSIVGGDMWFEWWNTGAEHKTFIGRYDPVDGDYLRGQQICTRYWDGNPKGNALRVEDGALHADAQGRVFFGGSSASGLPFDPTHATSDQSYTAGEGEVAFNPFPMSSGNNVYSGGAYLIVLSSDFSKRLYCTRLNAGTTRAVDARVLAGKSEPSLAWVGNVDELRMDWQGTNRKERVLHTVNPFQAARAGGTEDGFVAVVGQGGLVESLPGLSIEHLPASDKLRIAFPTHSSVDYQLMSSPSLNPPSWSALGAAFTGDGTRMEVDIAFPEANPVFFKMESMP